jgi:acyl-coenzyme A thioesterase PaaI-like protein
MGDNPELVFQQIVPMSAVPGPAVVPAPAPPTDKELVLKVIPLPADTNGNGDIFGGWVMAQVDLAGSVIPARIIRGRMATVAVKEFVFKQPVRVGDILSFYSSVTRIGRHRHDAHHQLVALGQARRGHQSARMRRHRRSSSSVVAAFFHGARDLEFGRLRGRPPCRLSP